MSSVAFYLTVDCHHQTSFDAIVSSLPSNDLDQQVDTMSGIEALSVACNIVQVISFAHETVSFFKAVYRGQSPNDYGEHNAASLSELSAQLQTHYQTVKSQKSRERTGKCCEEVQCGSARIGRGS